MEKILYFGESKFPEVKSCFLGGITNAEKNGDLILNIGCFGFLILGFTHLVLHWIRGSMDMTAWGVIAMIILAIIGAGIGDVKESIDTKFKTAVPGK